MGEAMLAGEKRRTCTTHCACGGKMQVQTTKLKRLAGRGRGRGQERMSVATSAGDSLRIALAPNALPVFASVHVTHNHTRHGHLPNPRSSAPSPTSSCCLDKTTSSKLSEAINSMYAWYAAAHVCYVWLHDVDDVHPSKSGPTSCFRSSWSTEG